MGLPDVYIDLLGTWGTISSAMAIYEGCMKSWSMIGLCNLSGKGNNNLPGNGEGMKLGDVLGTLFSPWEVSSSPRNLVR